MALRPAAGKGGALAVALQQSSRYMCPTEGAALRARPRATHIRPSCRPPPIIRRKKSPSVRPHRRIWMRCWRWRTRFFVPIACRAAASAASSPRRTAAVIVAELHGKLAGYALVLFRNGNATARLYSIAVAPHAGGRRIGATLLEAAEQAAVARGASALRLEVHEANAAAIALYKQGGLPGVRPSPRILRGQGPRAAVREAACARPSRASRTRRPISTKPPSSPAGRPA